MSVATVQTFNDRGFTPTSPNWAIASTDSTQSPLILRGSSGLSVVATIYHPVRGQTDSTPNIVASGRRINIRRAGEHRIIAVSRDLLSRWGGPLSYGDIVYLSGAGDLSGYYIVEDTMNKRYTLRVDILQSPGAPLAKYDHAQLHMDVN